MLLFCKIYIDIFYSGNLNVDHQLTFNAQHDGMVDILPSPLLYLPAGSITRNVTFNILGKQPGYLDITTSVLPQLGELR